MTWRDRVTRYDNRLDWVADRRTGAPDYFLGGTDGWKALRAPWNLYRAAKQWDAEEAVDAERDRDTDDGIWWEGPILTYVAEHYGIKPLMTGAEREFRIEHPRYPWLRPSPDAIMEHPELGLGVYDVKTVWGLNDWPKHGTHFRGFTRQLSEALPANLLKYIAQGIISLDACGPEFTHFGWILASNFRSMAVVTVGASPKHQAAFADRVAEWRERHLVGGVPPATDESAECGQHLRGSYEREGERVATVPEVELAREYAQASADEKTAKGRKDKARNLLTEAGNGSGHRVLVGPPEVEGGKNVKISIGARGVRVSGVEATS
jgi:hypothetical protein